MFPINTVPVLLKDSVLSKVSWQSVKSLKSQFILDSKFLRELIFKNWETVTDENWALKERKQKINPLTNFQNRVLKWRGFWLPHKWVLQHSLLPANVMQQIPAHKYWPSRQIMTWEWLRTLYEILHEVHTIKIRFHHCNDKIIFASYWIRAQKPNNA